MKFVHATSRESDILITTFGKRELVLFVALPGYLKTFKVCCEVRERASSLLSHPPTDYVYSLQPVK